MKFNKAKYNLSAFNTSDYLTISSSTSLSGKGEIYSKAIVEIDVLNNKIAELEKVIDTILGDDGIE